MKHFATLGAVTLAVALGGAVQHARAVDIGLAGPLSGDLASFGDQLKRGAEAAAADLNAAGGVLGEQINLVYGDDRCDPKEAVSVARKMANEGVSFVAGHFCSHSSIPASDVYWENDILQITPASTNPQLTEKGYENVFRTCGRDDQQGDFAGAWLAKNFASSKVAVIHDKSAYGKGLADLTRAAFEDMGGSVALYEAVNAGEQDYSALISKLKGQGIEAVYYGGYHSEMGLIARQSRDQGYSPTLISGDAQNTQELWSITGDAGEGIIFTFGPDPRNNAMASDIVERFRSEGYEPEGYTLYTYAAIQVWAKAAEAAGTFETGAVSDAIRASGGFDTVIGNLSYNSKGDRDDIDFTWYLWSEGSYSEVGNDFKPN
ncbi:MAG: branched-chain amino acid ABC transporter substrate-binding protein [Alphaproteobacteria bacterium]|nr:branched-chain amino acid ABC transporter substrate-binding protein [Alphaproteobacteria bacterium]MDA7982935.1 branched-chain amino acid ABC transporter substrate-binding protein [Alphaproteobacteria bacterium]MDA7988074.1 branched-chain amino acid ABC transporter substrate-binding protein [Alphaproteobacteria bacterium]MDA8000763.1 branched-chain amino acid ABC transporter substrate-binding protein [Alphaproteobacteria bacterium]MDA8006008.1 branched-chain amino acid ABC transporter substr